MESDRFNQDVDDIEIIGKAEEIISALESIVRALGGPGSGNFGHEGRPGEVGGSSSQWGSEAGGISREKAKMDRALVKATAALGLGKPKWARLATYEQRGAMKAKIVKDIGSKLEKAAAAKGIPLHAPMGYTIPGQSAAVAIAQDDINQWAATAGDHNERSVAMQYAAKEEFGIQDAAMNHFGVAPKSLPTDRLYSRIEYETTQKFLKNEVGLTHVTLFRGQMGLPSGDGERDVVMQPISSWTTSAKVAGDFAGHGHVMAVRVPVERVISTAATGRGCLNESEVLVLGGHMRVFAAEKKSYGDKSWKKKAEGYLAKPAKTPKAPKISAIPKAPVW